MSLKKTCYYISASNRIVFSRFLKVVRDMSVLRAIKKQDHSDSTEDFTKENLVHIQTPDPDDFQNLMGTSVFKDTSRKKIFTKI